MNYIHHLEAITRLGTLSGDQLEAILQEIGKKLTSCMEVERINIWLFQEKNSCIVCIGNYNAKKEEFTRGDILFQKDIPNYFSHLEEDKIMVIKDVYTDPITADLVEGYCRPLGIQSMMDVPIRIDGQLAGVLCYEHTGENREWTTDEQQFALAVNQVVAMAIESQQRRELQHKLENALHEKEILMREMHHRIKNNLSILVSLLRIHARESETRSPAEILAEFENKVVSISRLHEHLYKGDDPIHVQLDAYITTLLHEFENSSTSGLRQIHFISHLEPVKQNSGDALIIGLIINEIISNAAKYAFHGQTDATIHVELKEGPTCRLDIRDNGVGFNPEDHQNSGSMGLWLVRDLCEQLEASLSITSDKGGTRYHIDFNT